jgi:NAD(P)-dependent dehydrogenase (short-subunit alcohol dehydrogenase family)
MARLENKVVIVTGAASGIGRQVALGLAAEGASVVVADRDEGGGLATAEAVTSQGGTAQFVGTDVAQPAACEALARQTVETFGRIDAIHCNAGINNRVPSLEMRPEQWDTVIAVNLRGAFFSAQAAARRMAEEGGGSIVFTSSQLADFPRRQMPHYIAAKAGLLGLVRCLALEWGPLRIRVNAIQPGVIQTPINRDRLEDRSEREMDLVKIALGRLGSPNDIVGAVAFLVSDESAYVSGASIRIDGGWLGP